MTEAAEFLIALAQTVSTMNLYEVGHPARERAIDTVLDKVSRLQEVEPRPRFTFFTEEIVLGRRPIRELRRWDWSQKMVGIGIRRLELTGPVGRDDLELFLEDVHRRLVGDPADTAEVRQERPTSIRYGTVGIDDASQAGGGGHPELATATLGFSLTEEYDLIEWLHGEVKDGRELHMLEAEALVRSLTVAMHGDQAFMIPLLRLKRFDQYTTTHALNVSVLAMALSEFIGLTPKEVKNFGIAGLLHDLGKITIPDEILNKPGRLSEEERSLMNTHTTAGARIIMETEEHLDLAAVVAYEHHIKLNGQGYPTLKYARSCHQASDLVHVCDVFDALRTNRPYRDAWEQDRVLRYIEEGAGSEFEPELARAFVHMIRTWSDRIATVMDPTAGVPEGPEPGQREVSAGLDPIPAEGPEPPPEEPQGTVGPVEDPSTTDPSEEA